MFFVSRVKVVPDFDVVSLNRSRTFATSFCKVICNTCKISIVENRTQWSRNELAKMGILRDFCWRRLTVILWSRGRKINLICTWLKDRADFLNKISPHFVREIKTENAMTSSVLCIPCKVMRFPHNTHFN